MEKSIISDFVEAAIVSGKALEAGNSRVANKNLDKIRKIREQLKGDTIALEKYMVPLLEHEDDYVKLRAAVTLLPIRYDDAINIIKSLAKKEKPQLGFEADMIITELEAGRLKY